MVMAVQIPAQRKGRTQPTCAVLVLIIWKKYDLDIQHRQRRAE